MRTSFAWVAGTTGAAAMAGIMIVAATKIESSTIALAAAIAGCSALILVVRPFWGLVAIVALAQLDTLANIVSENLPISIVKILTMITLAGVILHSYREPRAERIGPREPALRYAVIYGLALFLTALYADDLGWVSWSIQKLGGMLVLFYLVVRLVRQQWQVDILVLVIVGATLLSSLVVLYDSLLGESLLATSHAATVAQFDGESRSAGASDADPTTAATMLLAGTTLALFLALRTPKWRWLNLITTAAGSAAIVFSFARSSAVAYGVAIAWLILKYRRHRHFPGVVAATLLIAVMSAPFVPTEYWDRLGSMGDIQSDPSLQRRVAYNMIGLDLLMKHPILGVGPGNFRVHYVDAEYRWWPGRTLVPRKLHNMYLSVAVEAGLFGILGFLGILLAAVVGLEDARARGPSAHLRLMAEALQFCFIAYLIASAFTPNEYNKYTWILAGLGIAITRLAEIDKPSMPLLFGKRSL